MSTLLVVDWKVHLGDLIELDFGLLDNLLTKRVLNQNQVDKIRKASIRSRKEAVDSLLSVSAVKSRNYEALITALQQTDQKHVANFITYHTGW